MHAPFIPKKDLEEIHKNSRKATNLEVFLWAAAFVGGSLALMWAFAEYCL